MTVSGKNGPAGLFYIEPDANAIEIQPDLVPDLINFYNQYKSVELKAVTEGSGKGITSELPDGNTVTVGGERFRRRRRHHFECSDQRVARTAAPQACHSFVAIHAPSNCTLDVIAWSAVISALRMAAMLCRNPCAVKRYARRHHLERSDPPPSRSRMRRIPPSPSVARAARASAARAP